jgi:hypothetical protein
LNVVGVKDEGRKIFFVGLGREGERMMVTVTICFIRSYCFFSAFDLLIVDKVGE